jgi:Fe-S cluster biogenesis protein NfuA
MFIRTETTPNPDALKFLPDAPLMRDEPRSFALPDFDPAASPLAARLFGIPGVSRVFVAADFVTVVRPPDGPGWGELRGSIIMALAEHIASGAPAVGAAPGPDPAGGEVEAEIQAVLRRHVRGWVARDGGDIVFDRFDPDTGVLWIQMQGACGGCPSSRLTLKAGVERVVRQYVPEVLRVEETPREAEAEARPSSVGERLKRWSEALTGRQAPPRGPVFLHNGRRPMRADPPPG